MRNIPCPSNKPLRRVVAGGSILLALGRAPAVVQAGDCEDFDCGSNGPDVHDGLPFGALRLDGMANGSNYRARTILIDEERYDLVIARDGSLEAHARADMGGRRSWAESAQRRVLAGEKLIGAQIVVENEVENLTHLLRIDDAAKDGHYWTNNDEVFWRYDVRYLSPQNHAFPICAVPSDADADRARTFGRASVLSGDLAGILHVAHESWSFVCHDKGLLKMKKLGYDPASTPEEVQRVVLSALGARYFFLDPGLRGASFTVSGMSIGWQSRQQSAAVLGTAPKGAVWWIEGVWTEDGLACLGAPRLYTRAHVESVVGPENMPPRCELFGQDPFGVYPDAEVVTWRLVPPAR
ncbi:MAG: hypothetical protein B7733_25945 [Myxococcales bacterium FL481]|nr:MAG: hypothetical protein B7733_25945 [Myxococcales bacterium FL481]